jgi:aminopeptidase YwaD
MSLTELTPKATQYLTRLCVEIPNRPVGSPGNRQATAFFADRMASLGFVTESPPFDCIYWTHSGARLTAGGESFQVFVSPYSSGCQILAPLVAASTLDELESAPASGKLLLLRGELTREQLMPKNFPFYNPEEHQHIYRLLETKKPLAILAATTRNPELAGALYPFPLIEDGDFDIPSVYLTQEEGDRLLQYVGSPASLASLSQRIPALGCNVIAARNPAAEKRIVLTAHIDAKEGTPGALDNAAGVVTLLLLAELLQDYSGRHGVEIVAVNGEDNYAAPGEIQYLQRNQGKMGDILLNINLDGVGYIHGATAFSLYECPAALSALVTGVFSAHPKLVQGEQWYQSDHMVFVQSGVPALALTSEAFMDIETQFAHTPKDTPDLVDPARLAALALAIRDLLLALDTMYAIEVD